MSLPELYGFLFSVCSSPEPVDVSEWMPVVFNGDDPRYKSDDKQARIEAALMLALDEVKTQVASDAPLLPAWCEILQPPLDNFGDDALLADWADGLFDGYDWLSEVWDANVDDETRLTLEADLGVLLHFSCREEALRLRDNPKGALLSKERLAVISLDKLPAALASYARIGRTLAQSNANKQPYVREVKLGRNDPCFCGSGSKYKKCCMHS